MSTEPIQPDSDHAEAPADKPWYASLPLGMLAFVAGFCVVLFTQVAFGGLIGVDGMYHIRLASMYLTGEAQAAGSNFTWTLHSIWNGNYADKEWLFHILLAPIVWLLGDQPADLIRAGVVGTSLLGGLIGFTGYRVFRANGLRWPLAWAILMLTLSETFVFRLSLCRSYLLSILLALIGWQVISQAARRNIGPALCAIAAVYALAYTAPHLLLVLAMVWGAVILMARWLSGSGQSWGDEIRDAIRPACWVVIGIAIGALLHPQTNNLLSSWMVQNLSVPLRAIGWHEVADAIASAAGYQPGGDVRVVDLGGELNPPNGRRLITNQGFGLLLMVLPWVLASFCRPRLTRVDAFAWLSAAGFTIAMLFSERFTEYFAPFAVLAGGMLTSRCLDTSTFSEWSQRRRRLAVGLTVTALLVIAINGVARPISLNRMLIQDSRHAGRLAELAPHDDSEGAVKLTSTAHAAALLTKHVPAGEGVYHAEWDMFPPFFFHAPEYRYINGLDPTFMVARSPSIYRTYRELADGEPSAAWRQRRADQVIREVFGVNYALIDSERNTELAKLLQRAELIGGVTLLDRTPDRRWRLYRLDQ